MSQRMRVVTGDTPEHAKHLIWDSHTDMYAESNGGLAFSIGVAVLEAETVRDCARFWKVCHQNGTELYYVRYDSGHTFVTKVF
jgi:enterochelin esterase-like enzyme